MDDSFLVRGGETGCDLTRIIEGGFERDGTAEVRTLHEFHDHGPFFDAVNSGDIRVVERCEDLRLTGKACHTLRVGGEGVGQDLNGDLAVELRIEGAVDSTHAALTKFGGASIVSDGESGGHAPALASYHLRNPRESCRAISWLDRRQAKLRSFRQRL